MNTPKQPKEPKRWTTRTMKSVPPSGSVFGIMNDQVAGAFGKVVSYWSYVEDAMIWILSDLLSGNDTSAMSPDNTEGQVFRSIISNDARIKLMRSLLTTTPQNKNRSAEFDAIIDEFERLNRRRNALVHGIWRTDPDTQQVTVAKSTPQGHSYEADVTVTVANLEQSLGEMRKLFQRIYSRAMI